VYAIRREIFLEKTLLLFSYSSTLEERDWRDNEKWEEESPPPYSSSQMENVASTETNIRKERERMRYTHNDVREREKKTINTTLSLSLCVCVCACDGRRAEDALFDGIGKLFLSPSFLYGADDS